MKFKTIAAALAGVTALCAGGLALSASQPKAPPAARTAQPLAPAPDAGKAAPAAPAPQAGTHALNAQDLEAWLDGMLPYALKSGDIAGVSVVVVKDGQVLFEKGYGYADVARKVPMDPRRTMTRIGSTSKLFTWTAVMQLVEQGKLDLDKDINAYLDFKPPRKFDKPITLRDLMNHRAGFEEGLKSILATDPKVAESNEQYLKNHLRPQLFKPGEVPAYSNYGAALAGYIVERVSGEKFDDYVDRHIFQPLGMAHSTFRQPLPAAFKDAISQGYMSASSPPRPFEIVTTSPAGSVSATADDMAHFMIAHLNNGRFGDYQMLKPETAQLMHTPSEEGLPGFAVMAHGMFHFPQNGHLVIGHGGDTIVFHTEMNLLPQDNVGIFYSFNSRGAQSAVYGARKQLFDGFMDRYFPAAPEASPPTLSTAKADAQAIAGRYQSSRRVEHGFISVFYLLQQSMIRANPDGTISTERGVGPGLSTLREIGPQLWREVDGSRELALRTVDGVKTVIDSEDPTSVLQAAPFIKSAPLNLTILLGAAFILLWTLLLWPISWLVRRGDAAQAEVSREVRRARLFARGAAAFDLVYLFGWFTLIQPLLGQQLQMFGPKLDPMVRTMQIGGLFAIAAAAVAVWSTWRVFRAGAPWPSKVWSVLVALATLGIVWIGLLANLIGFSLNY